MVFIDLTTKSSKYHHNINHKKTIRDLIITFQEIDVVFILFYVF